MIDASILANVVGDDAMGGRRALGEVRDAEDIAAPDLIDVETVAVLHKRWLAGTISDERFATAIAYLEASPLEHYPTLPLMRRAYDLRGNLTPYDATYIGLAEAIGCVLVTSDRRLAGAPGLLCEVKVL